MKIDSKLLLIALSVFCLCVHGQTLDDVMKARRDMRWEDAFNAAKPLAEAGNREAQLMLGLAYVNGQGTARNYEEAAKWLKLAADAGQSGAQNILANMYSRGDGFPVNPEMAYTYRFKSASAGNYSAMVGLAEMYINGVGIAKNSDVAKIWLQKVIEAPDSFPNISAQKTRAREILSKIDNEKSNYNRETAPASISAGPIAFAGINNPNNASQSMVSGNLVRAGLNQTDPHLICIAKLEDNPKLEIIKNKIGLSIFWDISFPMLSNQAMPNQKEQEALAYWADELRKCNSVAQYRIKTYGREIATLLDREDDQVMEAAIDLYNKKINYGKYNNRIQQIFKESKSALETYQQAKVEQEEQSKARAAAMRDAQQRQDQQRVAAQRLEEQRRQAEQAKIAAVRQQWRARCELDKRNAYERYMKSKENSCAGGNNALSALCVVGTVSAANDYAEAAFNSCMSSAPQ